MNPARLARNAEATLTDQLVAFARDRIDQRLWRSGERIPSIRQLAAAHGVSRFTAVAAYGRLEELGLVEARRGAGYYVRRPPAAGTRRAARALDPGAQGIDVHWLLRNMHGPSDPARAPGTGYLPPDWYPGELIASALRAVGRQPASALLRIGAAEGYRPLREWLQTRLASRDIPAPAEQIVLTHGTTQVLDLLARLMLQPGDTVLVEDPAWFLMFGRFASAGARVVGVPRRADGPDTVALERLAAEYRPRMFVVSPVCQNPTGSVLSEPVARRVLEIARAHGILVVEDDIYGELASVRAPRLAALDRLRSVVYCGGFSKILSPGIRVGFAAAAPALAARILDQKLLATLGTPEVAERVVLRVVSDPKHARHLTAMRARLDEARERAVRELRGAGWRVAATPASGAFVWADAGRDTLELAAEARSRGLLTAPGSLFHPGSRASTFMRFSAAHCAQPEVLRWIRGSARVRGRVSHRPQAGGPASP